MEINKKDRTELKRYFLANKIPTQKHFEDLVEATLNQAEDGIAKIQGSPLALQAEGDAAGTQEVLNLFSNFSDAGPGWSINLNPRVEAGVPGSNKPGLNFKNAAGESQLFIKGAGGNIGIGTIEPTSRLSIQARGNSSQISVVSETTGEASIFEVAQEGSSGVVSVRGGSGRLASQLNGDLSKPSFFLGKVGVGTGKPKANLEVFANDASLMVTNSNPNPQKSAKLRLRSRAGIGWDIQNNELSNHELRIVATASGGKGMTITRDGKVSALGGVNFGERTSHLNQDGSMYRLGGKLYLSIDDDFFIRDIGGVEKVHINSNTGRMGIGGKNPSAPLTIFNSGKYHTPDGKMHISNGCILFGGNNVAGQEENSAQISAGIHKPNSLNIVGMSHGSSRMNRKVDIWAEGGMTVRGHVLQTKAVAFSAYVHSNALSGSKSTLSMPVVANNIGNAYNPVTSKFTAPVKGIYLITMTLQKVGGGNSLNWYLVLNGNKFLNGASGSETTERGLVSAKYDQQNATRTVIANLQASDVLTVKQTGDGRPENYRSGWEGLLMHALPD